MSNQGLLGALNQFWDLQPKARLHRRNTYFDDHVPSNYDALRLIIVFSVLAIAIVLSWSLMGLII